MHQPAEDEGRAVTHGGGDLRNQRHVRSGNALAVEIQRERHERGRQREPSVNTAIIGASNRHDPVHQAAEFLRGIEADDEARMARTATYNHSNWYRNQRCVSMKKPGMSGIAGIAGGAPPNILALPACQTRPITGVSSSQKMISGRAMRSARFAQNPRRAEPLVQQPREVSGDEEEQRHAEDVRNEGRVAQELRWANCRSWPRSPAAVPV